VSAKEALKPKIQTWQIDGIISALDDGHPRVKGYALDELAADDLQNLKSLGKKPEEIAQKAAKILKDEKVSADVRGSAAKALGNLGPAAAKYLPDLDNILKDQKVDPYVRISAAEALGNLGPAAAKYLPDILNFLKDENVSADLRDSAARALGNLGSAAANYLPDILHFLKDENVSAAFGENFSTNSCLPTRPEVRSRCH